MGTKSEVASCGRPETLFVKRKLDTGTGTVGTQQSTLGS
jgi:hypothetical protein